MNYKGKIITTEKYIDMVGNPPGLADEDVISFSSLETKDGDPESWIGIKDFIPHDAKYKNELNENGTTTFVRITKEYIAISRVDETSNSTPHPSIH